MEGSTETHFTLFLGGIRFEKHPHVYVEPDPSWATPRESDWSLGKRRKNVYVDTLWATLMLNLRLTSGEVYGSLIGRAYAWVGLFMAGQRALTRTEDSELIKKKSC